MKTRRSIFWLCAAAVVLLALVVWYAKRPDAESLIRLNPPEAASEAGEQTPVVALGGRENSPDPSPRPNVASPVLAPNAAPTIPTQGKAERARETLSALNDVPVDFYGKLQDQFSNPVAGAEITGSIIFDNGRTSGVREIKTVSDASGFFEFHGGNGESLSVIPRKAGYALASADVGFKYSHFYPEARHIPKPSQPVVIEMRKLQGAERLIHFQTKAYVPLNGTPTRFDLQTGQRVESGGDIVVRIESSPAPNVTEKYDWKAILQAVDGGVMQSHTEFEKMYSAPESGYEPEFVVNYSKDAQPWSNGFNGGFYLKSRDGRSYGKLGLGINTDSVKNGAVLVMLNAYVNPAASRNLELDAALITKAKP